MKEYLNLREGQSISTNSLCDLARIILTEFYFKIGTDMYHQKVVTVIDTKSAPPQANMFIAQLEKISSEVKIF